MTKAALRFTIPCSTARATATPRPFDRFSTWLHGIALRLARQRLRGLLRRRVHEGRFMLEYIDAVSAAMPAANLDLERALATLPRRMRVALVLHAVEGYTQAETARLMGIAEGSVKAHVHRARVLLHERMNHMDELSRALRAAPREAEPRRNLWPAVESRIRNPRPRHWQRAAAAVVIFGAGALAGATLVERGRSPTGTP